MTPPQTCPTCGKVVDALRARSVRVRDGKVVAYCSNDCAAAAETRPTPTVAAPQAIPRSIEQLDSGPVIEIIREASTPALAERVRAGPSADDSTLSPPPTDLRRSRRSLARIAVVVVIVGGGATLLRTSLRSSTSTTPDARPVVVRADAGSAAVPTPDAVPAVTAADALQRAKDVLAATLASSTPRVQRVAAGALARTRDPRAIEALATALAKEQTDVARLDLAYPLARASDPRGLDALAAGLKSSRRDIKLQAGRLLAQLGDTRSVGVLAPYLEVTQLRLGTAEQLAQLAEPRALAVLRQVLADAKSSPDDRARATIALGRAGIKDVTADLKTLLADARNNAFAAAALAQLGDESARPILLEQLQVPSLRVEAARSLRRLDPTLDPAPHLPALVSALGSAKDTDQVQAAEAVLLLAGDIAWAERP